VEYIDTLVKFSQVENAKRITRPDTDFMDTRTNSRHRFKIARLFPSLDRPQFKSHLAPRLIRKITQIMERRPDPDDGFLDHALHAKLGIHDLELAVKDLGGHPEGDDTSTSSTSRFPILRDC
jgi:hypothetical protein